MAVSLLLTLPGNPFIYYGEELGMYGVKPDKYIREAFLWDKRFADNDRTNWRKPRYNTDSKVTPLKLQQADENSLYNHYRTLIHLRKSQSALNQISPPNLKKSALASQKVVSFIRPHETGDLLIVQNITDKAIQINLPTFEEVIFDPNSTANRNIISPYALIVLKL
jgi:glycosidase